MLYDSSLQQLSLLPSSSIPPGSLFKVLEMLHTLIQMNDYSEELTRLLAMPDHQGNPEVAIMQAMTNKLIENTCHYVRVLAYVYMHTLVLF